MYSSLLVLRREDSSREVNKYALSDDSFIMQRAEYIDQELPVKKQLIDWLKKVYDSALTVGKDKNGYYIMFTEETRKNVASLVLKEIEKLVLDAKERQNQGKPYSIDFHYIDWALPNGQNHALVYCEYGMTLCQFILNIGKPCAKYYIEKVYSYHC